MSPRTPPTGSARVRSDDSSDNSSNDVGRVTSRDQGPGLLLTVVISSALAAVSASGPALGIALPTLAADLGLAQTQLTYVSTIGTVVTAAALLPLGLAADRYGRRRFLVWGLLLFGVAEVATAAASSPAALLAARAVVALGAACVLPTTLAALVEAYPRTQRAKAVAIWAAVSSASASAAGLVSGALATSLSWRAVPLAVGLAALVVLLPVRRLVPDSRGIARRFDVPGAVLALVGVAGFVVGINQAGEGGLGTPSAWGPLAAGGAALSAFVAWELRAPAPLLPVRAFADPVLRTGALLVVLVVGSFGAFTFLAVQYLQFGRGLNPLQAALSFAVTDVGLLAVSPLLPPAVRRLGIRWVGSLGASLVSAALLALAATATSQQVWPTLVCLGVLGAGFALAITPATTLIVSGLPPDRLGTASALNYVNRDVGTAIGTAVVGAVLIAVYSTALTTALTGGDVTLATEQAAQATSGIAAATTLAAELGPQGQALADAARTAFLDGFRVAAAVAGALAAIGAVVCALSAPRGLTDTEDIEPVPTN